MATPTYDFFGLTDDRTIDSTTHGYYWQLKSDRTIDWSISDGFQYEFWNKPSQLISTIRDLLVTFSYYADIKFSYVGYFDTPEVAANSGSEINISLSQSTSLFPNSNIWARGNFDPGNSVAYPGELGDIFLNIRSDANWLPSYAAGSAGWFVFMHELGHTLGLKHPHDDGGTGRPTFAEVGYSDLNTDWASIMSYADDYNWNTKQWDPATPMILDVLALQYIYGKNMDTNAGDSTFSLSQTNTYLTIWDSSGNDNVSAAGSAVDWQIELPNIRVSTLVDTKVGIAFPKAEISLPSPKSLYWLSGDIENASGGSGNDTITGNDANNIIRGGAGVDILDGGSGFDTAMFAGKSSGYYLIENATSPLIVVPRTTNTRLRDGTDILDNIEQVLFDGDGVSKPASATTNKAFGLSYIASNPDLIKFFGTNVDAGVEHYIQSGINEGRTVTFDGLRYIASNPDLIKFFGTDADAGAAHYIQSGINEGRTTTFDGLRYIASNPDLIKFFGTDADAGAAHFVQSGVNEGRTTTFDGLRYIASNPDLIKFFGIDADAGVTHYIQSGLNEGRTVTFDGLRYIAANPDLIRFFGTNTDAGVKHYIQSGINEGRTSIFDANFYLAKNSDLRPHFGTNVEAATRHYILSGWREGRSMNTSGNDTLTGSPFADVLQGYSGNDSINGYEGNDALEGGNGNDAIYGGGGNDTFDYDVSSRSGNDQFFGGTGDDVFVFDTVLDTAVENYGEGSDTIWVSFNYSLTKLPYVENLRVYGSSGVTITGNAENNFLTGGSGNDVLAGGAGTDAFGFSVNQGVDRITDFSISQGDYIRIAAGVNGITTSTQALAHVYTDVNGYAAVDLGGGNSVSLVGVAASSLNASDFLIFW